MWLEKIYLHADGGRWINNGLEKFSNVRRVMDGFHLEKKLKEAGRRFPNRNLKNRIKEAMEPMTERSWTGYCKVFMMHAKVRRTTSLYLNSENTCLEITRR